MRLSLLLLALSTILIPIPAAKAQSVGRYSSAAAARRPGGGGPTANMGARRRTLGKDFYGGAYGNPGPNFWQLPWWYWWNYRYPRFWPNRFDYLLRPSPRSVRPGWDYQSSHREEQSPPSVRESGKSPSSPHGTDAYAPNPSGYGMNSYGDYPYTEYPYGQYEEGQEERSAYYDTGPVQFSYTPADIPQRPAVVRPERKSLASTILPTQTRMPLQNLIVMARPTTGIGFIPNLPAIDDLTNP